MDMRTFRTLNQPKKDLKEIQDYVVLIENYQPQDFQQQVIITYCLYGNVNKTAETITNKGYLIDARIIEPADISNIIKGKSHNDDLLHKKVKSLYLKKKDQIE